MKVYLQCPITFNRLEYRFEPEDTIGHVKDMLADGEWFEAENVTLYFNKGQKLQDKYSLVDYGICENTTIHFDINDHLVQKTFPKQQIKHKHYMSDVVCDDIADVRSGDEEDK